MPKQSVDELAKCIKDCKGDKACIKKCEDSFVADGGTMGASESGNVFTDQDGGKVFVTNGGKVF